MRSIQARRSVFHAPPGLSPVTFSARAAPPCCLPWLKSFRTTAKFAAHITITRDDLEVNAKSIMGVMMLAAECGAEILLRADGADEVEALEALAAVIASGFGER